MYYLRLIGLLIPKIRHLNMVSFLLCLKELRMLAINTTAIMRKTMKSNKEEFICLLNMKSLYARIKTKL